MQHFEQFVGKQRKLFSLQGQCRAQFRLIYSCCFLDVSNFVLSGDILTTEVNHTCTLVCYQNLGSKSLLPWLLISSLFGWRFFDFELISVINDCRNLMKIIENFFVTSMQSFTKYLYTCKAKIKMSYILTLIKPHGQMILEKLQCISKVNLHVTCTYIPNNLVTVSDSVST